MRKFSIYNKQLEEQYNQPNMMGNKVLLEYESRKCHKHTSAKFIGEESVWM